MEHMFDPLCRDHTGDHHLGRHTPDIIRQAQAPPSPVEHAYLNILIDTRLGDGAADV